MYYFVYNSLPAVSRLPGPIDRQGHVLLGSKPHLQVFIKHYV